MAAVAVPMKIGVILVNLYVRAAQRTVAPGGGGLENALSSAIAGDQIAQRSGIPVWNIPDACGRCKTGLRSGEPDRFSSRGTKTDDARPAWRTHPLLDLAGARTPGTHASSCGSSPL